MKITAFIASMALMYVPGPDASAQIGASGGPVVAASNCSTVAPLATGCIPVNIAGVVHYIPYQ